MVAFSAVASSSKSRPPAVLRSTAEFARHIGLARTTVSRVLNGQPGLRPKTIERVQRALAETGFTPNAHAVHLKGKRTAAAVRDPLLRQGRSGPRHSSALWHVYN